MCPLIWKCQNYPFSYEEIVEFWSEFSLQKIDTNSTSHSESLWYNSHIRINNDTLLILHQLVTGNKNSTNNLIQKLNKQLDAKTQQTTKSWEQIFLAKESHN